VRWATYYGGSLADLGTGCATDSSGNIFLAGYSVSTGIATAGAHQDTFAGNWDAYIVKFNHSGIRQWATYYGGSGDDRVYGCASDSAGNVYISGRTNSTTAMATPGSHQPINNSANAFLVKFDSGGIRQWGT